MKQNVLILIDFIKKLYLRRSMVRSMAIRDLKARYIGSVFGFFWAVIFPLCEVAIYGIVFGVFFSHKPDPSYNTDSFILFLICGLIPWQFFLQSINGSIYLITSNTNMIKKSVGFPSEILPIINITTNILTHMIGIGIILLFVVTLSGSVPLYLPLITIYLFFIVIFSVGIGWILSSLNVYLKDVGQVVGLITRAWFFFTPIFYSPSIVPEAILPIYKLNPMYHVVTGYRYAILAGKLLPFWDLAYLAGISLFTFALGGLLFKKLKPGFAEVL